LLAGSKATPEAWRGWRRRSLVKKSSPHLWSALSQKIVFHRKTYKIRKWKSGRKVTFPLFRFVRTFSCRVVPRSAA
jgi:hypothetical protein